MKNTISVLALAALFPLADTAMAADKFVGGDCCADLEERIAELEATTAKKGNTKVSLTVYGQVNSALTYVDFNDEDLDEEIDVRDNAFSQSRFGFKGEGKITPDVSMGFVMEVGIGGAVNDDDPLDIRKAYWFVKSDAAGTLSVGQNSTATDYITQISVANLGGAVATFKYFLGEEELLDGDRDQIVRYDSPSLAGFVVSASIADEDKWDAALRYAGELGQFKIAGGVGFSRLKIEEFLGDGKQNWDVISGSVSVMHVPSGLFLNGAYGQTDLGETISSAPWSFSYDADLKLWHLLGGIEARLFQVGKTTFYGEYAKGDLDLAYLIDDSTAAGVERFGLGVDGEVFGGGVVQAFDAAAMDIYFTVRKYDIDGSISYSNTEVDPVEKESEKGGILDPLVFMTGARIKF